jgi:catechol 2,3-dioxygenase-like lactoylglutathione lyase family enzyme
MKLEHVALNVSDPTAAAKWYADNLGMRIASQRDQAPFTTFVADESGKILLEFYNNPPNAVPPYKDMDPLLLHVAFLSQNPAQDKNRLVAAGATFVSDQMVDGGTQLIMLRDPWGLALQLVKRGTPYITP